MTMPAEDKVRSEAGRGEPGAEEYGLTPETVRAVGDALRAGDAERVRAIAEDLYAADVAGLIASLTPDERRAFIDSVRGTLDPEVLPELDEQIRDEVFALLHPEDLAAAVQELDTDDALDVVADLDEAQQTELLARLPVADRMALLQGLTYPEYSAGRLMQRDLVAVPAYWTVGETIDFMRASPNLPDDFYDIFVVDPRHRPVGTVSLSRVLRNRRPVRIADIMASDLTPLPVSMDQEELARVFRQQDLVSAPVVDDDGRLVGVVTVDDVVDVIDEEAEDDLMKLGGAMEQDVHASAGRTVRRRQRWLLITLANTILASIVISQFEGSIEAIVALAVLMPIVAAMGGNAGMQVVTVVVRALATRDLTAANTMRVVRKEIVVGAINGLVFATIMSTIAVLWFKDLALGAVLATAMIFNMMWAGLAGTIIPLALNRAGVDPAVAAGPFLTTTTDVLGFFVFLGLATWFLI
ncbi:MAG: magnesium transporter [Alphaproteobacteria bacterium]